MEIYVGTCGWTYSWNPDGLDWYIKYSGFNAVELNMSFYRFPYPNQVKSWARKSRGKLRWAIKVNRFITHRFKLSEKALKTWIKFHKLFQPLDEHIDFYLFQLPPTFKVSDKNIQRIKWFYEETGLGTRFALEVRDKSWTRILDKLAKLGLTVVSVDAPELHWVINTNNIIYLRIHGRTSWYAYRYTLKELHELAQEIIQLKPDKIYAFFNNNHGMLDNGRQLLKILENIV